MSYHAIVAAAALLAAATPAGAAPLRFHLDRATTPTAGAPVEMHFTATCSPAVGNAYALRVTLAQRTGRTVTTTTTETRRSCTGRPQAVALRAAPPAASRPGPLSITACLRVLSVLPHRAAPPAWPAGTPPCTTTPRTAILAVPA